MQVIVETKTEQIIDGEKHVIEQKGKGTFEIHEKGSVLSWKVKEEKQEFKMTILENKIILKTNNGTRNFELGKTTKSFILTEYGNMDMNITTHKIEIIKEKEPISKIKLKYDIELQETMKYLNIIEINITEELNK
mgnify:CR=1 FL=1